MYVETEIEARAAVDAISTGHLPDPDLVARSAREAYDRYRMLDEGIVADYIPALARASRHLFGFCIVGVNGAVYEVGDAHHAFSIQSISKPFVFAVDSEAATNLRNRGIARLLEGYGRMYFDALEATDVYTKQCSLRVSAKDLAVMAATLADGGVNPLTGKRVISAGNCKRALAILATAGLYERSGDWLYEIGLPGKSGVSGGIVTMAPGKGGLGTFAPPLDGAGNSVKGQRVTKYLSERLGLNLFASKPEA